MCVRISSKYCIRLFLMLRGSSNIRPQASGLGTHDQAPDLEIVDIFTMFTNIHHRSGYVHYLSISHLGIFSFESTSGLEYQGRCKNHEGNSFHRRTRGRAEPIQADLYCFDVTVYRASSVAVGCPCRIYILKLAPDFKECIYMSIPHISSVHHRFLQIIFHLTQLILFLLVSLQSSLENVY